MRKHRLEDDDIPPLPRTAAHLRLHETMLLNGTYFLPPTLLPARYEQDLLSPFPLPPPYRNQMR